MKADRHIDEDHSIEELQEHSENLAHEDHHGVPHPRTGCASSDPEGHCGCLAGGVACTPSLQPVL